MFNVYDLMRQAQGGAAFDNVARAYGLQPGQMQAAMAALTPAFAQGFQRQAASDHAARGLNDLMGAETYARAFEAQAAAFDPATKAAGDDALGALFGSKEVSRAVAAQAAAASGVQAEIIRKVLPVLTSILIGGFMKAAQGAGPPPQPDAPTTGFPGPMGAFWDQILSGMQGAAAPSPQARAEPDALKNPFQDWMGGFGQPSPREPAETRNADSRGENGAPVANPMGDMMAEILNGMFDGPPKAQTPDPDPAEAPGPELDAPAEATPFDQMVQSGRELQAQNARAMEQIFDAFLGGKQER